MKNSYIAQAWLVIVLSLCFGVALAAVQTTLSPKIDANKLRDTIGQIPNLVPGAADLLHHGSLADHANKTVLFSLAALSGQ